MRVQSALLVFYGLDIVEVDGRGTVTKPAHRRIVLLVLIRCTDGVLHNLIVVVLIFGQHVCLLLAIAGEKSAGLLAQYEHLVLRKSWHDSRVLVQASQGHQLLAETFAVEVVQTDAGAIEVMMEVLHDQVDPEALLPDRAAK